MISIKRYLESNRDELLSCVLECYRAALAAMGTTSVQACPPVGSTLHENLSRVLEKISPELPPPQMLEAEAEVEQELEKWAEGATEYYRQRTKEFKELLLVMASTADAVGERDTRYQARFQALSARLAKMADLQDLKEVRASLMTSATELKTCVQEMAQDGKETVAQLRAEVQQCRARIEEVERIAVVDRLTGLSNRQGIESALEFRLTQKRPFCLMMLDLNGFKKLNDQYGHLAGDQLLKQFATELKGVFRATDCVGRWAGDEFVVVFDSSAEEAKQFAERVQKWVFGNYTVEDGATKRKVHVDAALGVTEWQPGETRAALLGRADKLMYGQKSSR